MSENSVVQLRKWLATDEKPVSATEMMEFWNSLTDEEKAEYKSADLD